MKKELLVASAFAAFAALAADTTVVTSNEMGFVPVSSELSKAEGMYLVTAPFSGYASGTNIKVAEFLQTANLAKDDELFIPNGAGYDNYKLNASKVWVPIQKCTISGGIATKIEEGTPATEATVARGTGFFVKTSAAQINLFGNAEKTAQQLTVTGWKLIGSTIIPAKDIAVSSLGGGNGDMIILADGTRYQYKSSAWKKYVAKVEEGQSHWADATKDTIPAGVAFWYNAVAERNLTF